MAFNAAMEWEVRTSGSNNNGGGYYDAGGASADYSQQDAAQLSLSDVVTNGTTTVTSATGGFTDAMVGNVINILTKGRRQITARSDTNTITVDATVTAGTGLTGNVGGAVADLEQIDSILINGNNVHVKAGTYTASGGITIANGSQATVKALFGYNVSRGDKPTGDNRPLLAMGANLLYVLNYNQISHFRVTTTHNWGLYSGNNVLHSNCKVTSTGGATTAAFRAAGYGVSYIDCEADVSTGHGFVSGQLGTRYTACWSHGGGQNGFELDSNYAVMVDCIVNDMATGINVDANNVTIVNCTVDGHTLGVDVGSVYGVDVSNCQIANNTTGLSASTTSYDKINNYDYNNWYGNGTDISNHTKGDNATADDPGYADQPNEDFSDVDDANAFTIRLGVG